MSIPILKYSLTTQNQRVNGLEVNPGEEQPKVYTTENLLTALEMDELIWAGYRQVFSEHQILNYTRDRFLESQLRFNQITVKDFIVALILSDSFRRLNRETNNNYRLVEMCVQRILGRDVYNQRERLAFAIVIADKGFEIFIRLLVNSAEYIESFGDTTVPYQRRRILAQRVKGEIPFNLKTPRLTKGFATKQNTLQLLSSTSIRRFRPQEQLPRAGDPALFLTMVPSVSPLSS
uniref:Phycobilisome rod-core linker protein n=1 Tax=Neogoniolithon spectabile TaxID=231755 RepID=A0A3G3MH03_9FLOR|nr:phycobilisome rod-core linker protein [Neogoniolithon spectabile]AYR06109.1 phycobilisome rod-core linker protein [Neogoniolithon spectabile]